MSKKNRRDVVYSTNPDFNYEYDQEDELETLAPEDQELKLIVDRKQRKGKVATIIAGFVGTTTDLKALEKLIKAKCGVGGSSKDGEIIIQGELRDKIDAILKAEGYKTKRVGG